MYAIALEKDVSILAGPSSCDLARKIAKDLKDIAALVPVDVDIFSDGESKIKINNESIRKKPCVVIQSTYPPTDRHLLQALMMIKKCADDNAVSICSVIPYMAYARQDKAFLEGEVVSIALVAKLLEDVSTNHMITVDIHSMKALSYFTIDVQNISSIPLLARYAINYLKLAKPIVTSPDKGGAKRAEEFAEILKTDVIVLNKYRDKSTGKVTISEKLDLDISDKEIILVDDMISSGDSIIKACEVLKKNKCSKIYAMCAHALLLGDSLQRIKAAGVEDIIATNSIPGQCAKIDLSPILSSAIRKAVKPSR
jgi:ribose-phosphate pyrophosphokinase